MEPNVDGFPNYHIKRNGDLVNIKTGRVLKPINRGDGYIVYCLSGGDKRRVLKQHRLLALAYIPNPDNKPHINHIDSNPSNNDLENLEWVTHKENMEHMVKSGRRTPRRPKRYLLDLSKIERLTKRQQDFAFAVNRLGYPQLVMEELGIDKSAFYRMLKRVQKRLESKI